MKQRSNRGPDQLGSVQQVKSKSKGRKPSSKKGGKRWHLGFDNLNVGPFGVSNFSMGSGDKRSIQGPQGAIRTNENLGPSEARTLHTRREQIGVVNGSVSFAIREYQINPGNSALFPWLSQLAPLYEQYKIHDMFVEFVQTGSGYAAPNVSGRVVLSCDYDVMSPPLATLQEAEGKDPNVPFAPYESAVLRLDAQRLTPSAKFNRGQNYPAGGDPKTYDAGKVSVITQGTPNANQIGILYVSYVIELITPQLPQVLDVLPNYHLAVFQADVIASIANTTWTPINFTRLVAPAGGDLTVPLAGANFTFQPGPWRISLIFSVTNTTSQLQKLRIRVNYLGGNYNLYGMGHDGAGALGLNSATASCSYVLTATQADQIVSFEVYTRQAGGTTSVPGEAICLLCLEY